MRNYEDSLRCYLFYHGSEGNAVVWGLGKRSKNNKLRYIEIGEDPYKEIISVRLFIERVPKTQDVKVKIVFRNLDSRKWKLKYDGWIRSEIQIHQILYKFLRIPEKQDQKPIVPKPVPRKLDILNKNETL